MSDTISLYLIRFHNSIHPPARGWALRPFSGVGTEAHSHEHFYVLPVGYRLGETQSGDPTIYDSDGNPCDLLEHCASRRPQLVSAAREAPVLAPAPDDIPETGCAGWGCAEGLDYPE